MRALSTCRCWQQTQEMLLRLVNQFAEKKDTAEKQDWKSDAIGASNGQYLQQSHKSHQRRTSLYIMLEVILRDLTWFCVSVSVCSLGKVSRIVSVWNFGWKGVFSELFFHEIKIFFVFYQAMNTYESVYSLSSWCQKNRNNPMRLYYVGPKLYPRACNQS